MAWDLTISGTSIKSKVDSRQTVKIDWPPNERATLTFRTRLGANYSPTRFAAVVAYAQDGITPIFGGVVLRSKRRHVRTTKWVTDVTCTDYWFYLDKSPVELSFSSAVTLEDALDEIISQVDGSLGFSVHASQVTGPTLAAYEFTGTATAAIKDLLKRAEGWMAQVSPLKVVRAFVPGTAAAPYSLTDGDGNCETFEVEDSDRTPSNRVVLWCGPDGAGEVTQVWVADGVATSWVTDIPAAIGGAAPGYVTVGGIFKTVGSGAQYEWDAATSTLTVGTDSAPGAAVEIELVYIAQFPFKVTRSSGATPALAEERSDASITEYGRAVETAEALLAVLNQDPDSLSLTSRKHGWEPGQGLIVNVSAPPVNATYTIGGVSASLMSDTYWRYTFGADETEVFQGSRLDLWRETVARLANRGAGSAVVVSSGGGGGTTTVLSSPFPLGGSRTSSQPLGTTRTPVIDWLPFVAPTDMTVRVRASVRAREGGVEVTPLLEVYNGGTMAWDLHQTGAASEVTVDTEQLFVAALAEGDMYRLGYVTDSSGASGYCIGQLENVT